MDRNTDFLAANTNYAERPIILSPPPVEAGMTFSHAPQNFQAQRNLSVGFNLQQEFEALKADLDLDLSRSNDDEDANIGASMARGSAKNKSSLGEIGETSETGSGSGAVSSSGSGSGINVGSPMLAKPAQNGSRVLSGGPSLLAPAANSPYALNTGLHSNGHGSGLLDTMLREHTLSPLAGGSSSNGGGAGASAGASVVGGGSGGVTSTTGASSNSSATGATSLQSLLMNKNAAFASLLGGLPSRPQSVNDFSLLMPQQQPFLRMPQVSSGNFYLDMLTHTSWLESLTPQEIMTTLDYWCNNLPFDILLTMKSRLHNHLSLGMQPLASGPPVFGKVDAYPQYQGDFVAEMSNLGLLQPKPKPNGAFKSHLFADPKVQRPKLADPSMHNRNMHAAERARSPTLHLYEKTNFLQLAAASHLPHHHHAGVGAGSVGVGNAGGYGQSQGQAPGHHHNLGQNSQSMAVTADDGYDHSHKLGALATINSRVALDFNRKVFQQPGRAAAYEELLNRQANSSSVPTNTQKYSVAAMAGAAPGNANVVGTPKGKKDTEKPKISSPSTPVSASSSMPAEIVNQDLLNNIPAWLKLLRLHKYTDYLKDIYWKDLVELSDQDLEDKGVKALGARRKLLKAFEAVKAAKA